ncbi:hypothetical protein ACHWQZ_G017927 [Mnemiopsis leidyi]
MMTGLAFGTSDVDVIVELAEDGIIPQLRRLARALRTTRSRFTVVNELTKPRIPLIKTMHKETKRNVDISFMCPSMPRWCAVKNTTLIRVYMEQKPEMRKAFGFLKIYLGHKPTFSAQTQGISSYGWAILMIQYCIHEKVIFVDPTSFTVSLMGHSKTAAEILTGFLNYVLERLPWEDVDITHPELPTLKNQIEVEEIPKIQDPHESGRNLSCYLNDETWSRLQSDIWDLRADLIKSPTAVADSRSSGSNNRQSRSKRMSRNDRSQPITNRVIYREGDVDVIEEDLKEIYPIFKWANHLETIWVILLLLQKAQLDGEATRAVMDYLVSSIENVQTRDALLQLSRSPLGKLMRLAPSRMINRNRYWCSDAREWLDFCTGEERRKAISLGLTVVRTACQLHTILRKTMVQLVDDMPQEDARRVVMVAIRETYKLQA